MSDASPRSSFPRTFWIANAMALVLGSGAREARPQAAGTSPLGAADAAAFVERTFGIGNEGLATPNARRYAISPDWTTLAAPRDDGSVQLFDVATGQPVARALEGGFKVGMFTKLIQPSYFGFSSDGSLLVWSLGKKLVAWRVATREIVLRQEIEDFATNPWGEGVHLGPQGRFITWLTKKGATLWDTSSRKAAQNLAGDVCAFSPDGRWLALVARTVWDLERQAPWDGSFEGLCLGWSPDGRLLTTSPSGGIQLRDLSAARPLSLASAGMAWAPAWSADGRFLAFLDGNHDVEVWDLRAEPPTRRSLPSRNKGGCKEIDANGRRLGDRMLHLEGSAQLVLSNDGRFLCDSCQVTDIWDLSQPTPLLMQRTGLLPMTSGRPALSRDGRTLAYAWGRGEHLHGHGGFALWDAARGRPLGPSIELGDPGAMEFSPDGRLLATVGYGPTPSGKKGFVVQLWNVEAMRAAGEPKLE
jgi:WD40 repeat protein